jgi:hypothetical protein
VKLDIKVYTREDGLQPPPYTVIVGNRFVYLLSSNEEAPPVFIGEKGVEIRNPLTGMKPVECVPVIVVSRLSSIIIEHARSYGGVE